MDSLPEENRGLLVARISPRSRPEIDSLPEENRHHCPGGTRLPLGGAWEVLNMDGLTGVKAPKDLAKDAEASDSIKKRSPIELYRDRMSLPCKSEKLVAELPQYNLLRFSAETDMLGKEEAQEEEEKEEGEEVLPPTFSSPPIYKKNHKLPINRSAAPY